MDDGRSPPIPFTGALVHPAIDKPAPGELISATITERDENPGETRLELSLGAANLSVARSKLKPPSRFLRARSRSLSRKVSEDTIQRRNHRAGHGLSRRRRRPAAFSKIFPCRWTTWSRSRELFLLIKNGDSPPLPISAVRVERRPVYLVFLARQPGTYHLLTGNAQCDAPQYDLAALGMNLKSVAVSPIKVSPPSDNPDFRAPEVLPGLEVTGAALDVSDWKFRKPVKISRRDGAQQIELDLEVLAHAQPGFEDLRVLRRQQPGALHHPAHVHQPFAHSDRHGDERCEKSEVEPLDHQTSANRFADRTRLTCVTRTPLFERSLSLYEELTDERGDKYRRVLGGATWTQTPERQSKEFTLAVDGPLQSDTLFLETDNGDNPPIELEKFTAFYPATRILFKAKPDDELFLYYGNPHVAPPRYDLSLVAEQLLAAEKNVASIVRRTATQKIFLVQESDGRARAACCFGEFWRWWSSCCSSSFHGCCRIRSHRHRNSVARSPSDASILGTCPWMAYSSDLAKMKLTHPV